MKKLAFLAMILVSLFMSSCATRSAYNFWESGYDIALERFERSLKHLNDYVEQTKNERTQEEFNRRFMFVLE